MVSKQNVDKGTTKTKIPILFGQIDMFTKQIYIAPAKKPVGRPKKVREPKEKKPRGRPRKNPESVAAKPRKKKISYEDLIIKAFQIYELFGFEEGVIPEESTTVTNRIGKGIRQVLAEGYKPY